MKKNEIKVWACHVPSECFEKIMTDEFMKVAEQFRMAFVQRPKDPMRYIGAFVFHSEKERDMFVDTMSKIGIRLEPEKLPAYVDAAFGNF